MKRSELDSPTRRRLLMAAVPLSLAPAAWAQAGTAHIVVGFAPGGAADGLARLMSDKLRGVAGTTVVVDNRVGAGARIAIDYTRLAPADGSVMVLVPDAAMVLYPYVYKKLSYEPERDFMPVTRLIGMSLAMFVGPMVPDSVATVPDYVAWVKADSKRLIYGTPAAGATPHFTGAMFASAAGLDMTPVHYKGGAPGIQDLAAGQVPVFFGSVADGMALVQAGKVRALATSGAQRAALLPNVPTFAELGYKDLVVEDGLGVYVPIKTPADTVAKLNAAMQQGVRAKDVQDAVRNWGFEVSSEGPREFAARLQRERTRWGQTVRATGFVAID